MPTNPIRYVDERKASEITGFAVQSLRNWRSLRRGPSYMKIGSTVRYRVDDLFRFMEAGRIEPEGSAEYQSRNRQNARR